MNRIRPSLRAWRSVCMTLAALALVLKIAIPAGYMIGPQADAAFPLVICTAQGAVVLDPPAHDDTGDHKAPAGHDSPCAFTGHGAAFLDAPSLNAALFAAVVYEQAALPAATYAAPGQGLAAPPLPARGPPHLI